MLRHIPLKNAKGRPKGRLFAFLFHVEHFRKKEPSTGRARRIYPLKGEGYHSCGAQNFLRQFALKILTAAFVPRETFLIF